MKRENSPIDKPTLSVEYEFKLKHSSHKRKPKSSPSKTVNKLPHVTRLLALAHHLQGLVKKGTVNDYADIAKLSNLSRARLSQIMNLTLLAPEIQEEILSFTTSSFIDIREHDFREILKAPVWDEQAGIWSRIKRLKKILIHSYNVEKSLR